MLDSLEMAWYNIIIMYVLYSHRKDGSDWIADFPQLKWAEFMKQKLQDAYPNMDLDINEEKDMNWGEN